MRTSVSIAKDALLIARELALRDGISLGDAISELVRRGAAMDGAPQALRGRFALLPRRGEIITPQHVRALLD